ncbi:Rpn family recombination-promoting nuclease/putative transposase [Thiocapsa sp.]|uniref:Rpn family recombination-promoting nuclease/putative transposase n=1 Tax=Thiocapsa sp. TaxID=2024551 RepID=UPI002B73A1C8|nr:Rpn family recombination-promoting nuclease/putative transposase [Thiocapsa sp.]HSO81997.1 Rpn family recombination-promoting nuclease/putative transposase [Thiocapsa sp.]
MTRKDASPRHHDHSYRQLFSHVEMVRDLLTGFVRDDWVGSLDLDSLEPVKGSFVTDDYRDREDDVIWRFRWSDGWLYVYILIEFQSTEDRFMAVRIANYATLLYQDLIARSALSPSGRLPPVLPIVLYNGEPRWTAQTDLFALIEPVPGGLERYRPQWSYLLLDEGAIACDEAYPPEVRNLVAALFRLEKARDEPTWLAVYARLVELLDSAALDSLKRAFGRWIYRSFIRKKRPGIQLPSIDDFNEVHVMLQQRVEQWNAEILERGRQEGRQEGRRETALELIRKTDFDDATIADISKLPLEEIQALRNLPSAH